MTAGWIRHPLLDACGVEHGFGLRDTPAPEGVLRPRQVHGAAVTTASICAAAEPAPAADAIVSTTPGRAVAIVTADCVPLLIASADGRAVAAVHAGWRGLAAGVIEAAVAALGDAASGCAGLVAVVGPHIAACCYEVDAPVLAGLGDRFGDDLVRASRPTRPGHVALDLGLLAVRALEAAGLEAGAVDRIPDACTRCDAERFHSHRREGARAGRLVHYIAAHAHEA